MHGGTQGNGGGIAIVVEDALAESRGVSVEAALWMCVLHNGLLGRNVW
jgi:hypothetical protein